MKENVQEIKENVQEMKENVQEMKVNVQEMEEKLQKRKKICKNVKKEKVQGMWKRCEKWSPVHFTLNAH